MAGGKAFDLDRLFEGSLLKLRAEAEYFSRLTDHDPELGRLNETHLVRLLRSYLPPKIGIGTGFVASGGAKREQSPQCDIILYDALNNAPLYTSDTWSIYPVEMVYGVIEVKTSLNQETLKDAFHKCEKVRALASGKNKAYIIPEAPEPKQPARYKLYYEKLPPRFYVFAYGGWKTMKPLQKNFESLSENYKTAHIHGVCCLNGSKSNYVWHKAYKKGPERFGGVENTGFRHFLLNLPSTLNSMLPNRRMGLGFDLINLEHYNFTTEVGKS